MIIMIIKYSIQKREACMINFNSQRIILTNCDYCLDKEFKQEQHMILTKMKKISKNRLLIEKIYLEK